MTRESVRRSATILAITVFTICTHMLFAGEGLTPGVKAPAFSLPAVGTGKNVTLQSYAGKSVVILHFWKSK